MSIVIPKEQ